MDRAVRIKHARELRGLTQSELARMPKLRPQAVQQRVRALAQVLQISEAWLATGDRPMTLTDMGDWGQLTPDERALVEKYRQLGQGQENHAQADIDAFASAHDGKEKGKR